MPIELKIPVKTTHVYAVRVSEVKFERIIIDNVNNWTYNSRPVVGNALKKWL
ncbi:hypothetical protein X975_01987, partial [Stegodyphus mimosarum]